MDGHPGGLDATALACRLSARDAQMVVAHVVTDHGESAPDPAVAQALAVCADHGGAHTGEVVHRRSIVRGLHELVEQRSADLLVVGAYHHSHLGRVWARDHTSAALRDAPCPVAVAPWGYAARAQEAVRAIGVGYEDDSESRDALDAARGLAWDLQAEVHATLIVPPSNWETPEAGAGWRAVEAGRRMAEIPGIKGAAAEGDVYDKLAALAGEVDLLVVGSHHHGVLRRLLMGDTVEHLSRDLPCPLLVMPHPTAV